MAKRSVFCRIDQWLEKKDPALFEAADHLCVMHTLKPRPGGGVTFLYPLDKKYREDIIKGSIGDSDEQIMAEKMFKSLVLQLHLPDVGAFQTFSDDIPNALGFQTMVGSVKGSSVSFSGDLSASPAKDFQPRGDRNNMSVWELEGKDHLPVDGSKALGTHTKKKNQKGGGRKAITDRVAFARHIEDRFRYYAVEGKLNECDPYAEALASLFVWLKGNGKLDVLRSLLTCCSPKWRPSFYIVFQPYSNGKELLSSSDFTSWQNETLGYCLVDSPAQYYLSSFSDLNSEAKDQCAKPESRAAVRDAIEGERQRLLGSLSKVRLAGELQQVYSSVSANNRIGALDNIYPQPLADYYRANPEDKAVQEEIRLLIGNAFDDLESSGLNAEEFKSAHREIVDIVEHRLNFQSGYRVCMLFNLDLQSQGVMWYSGPFALLRSSYFLYLGAPQGESSAPRDVQAVMPNEVDPSALVMVDIVAQDWALAQATAGKMTVSDKRSAVQRTLELTARALAK